MGWYHWSFFLVKVSYLPKKELKVIAFSPLDDVTRGGHGSGGSDLDRFFYPT